MLCSSVFAMQSPAVFLDASRAENYNIDYVDHRWDGVKHNIGISKIGGQC